MNTPAAFVGTSAADSLAASVVVPAVGIPAAFVAVPAVGIPAVDSPAASVAVPAASVDSLVASVAVPAVDSPVQDTADCPYHFSFKLSKHYFFLTLLRLSRNIIIKGINVHNRLITFKADGLFIKTFKNVPPILLSFINAATL